MPEDPFLLDTQRTAIEALERLIVEIRSGEVVELIGLVTLANDTYRVFGGEAIDRHRTAGMLLDLAVERLRR